jgi:nicotinate-nucleotide pyrophosphorylase (carboxylating)
VLRSQPAKLLELESSGRLALENAAADAGVGVEYLSVEDLMHSVRVLDISLDL